MSLDTLKQNIKEFTKEENKICHNNYKNVKKGTVEDCKVYCSNDKNCKGFSYPYHGGKEGCRIDTKGNCKPGSYNGYTYYQVK